MANKSGIHINPKNKGKFSAKAKKAGMSTQAFAKHVKAHPDNYSGKTRQEANFARVSKTKFKHQTGGPIQRQYANPSPSRYNFGPLTSNPNMEDSIEYNDAYGHQYFEGNGAWHSSDASRFIDNIRNAISRTNDPKEKSLLQKQLQQSLNAQQEARFNMQFEGRNPNIQPTVLYRPSDIRRKAQYGSYQIGGNSYRPVPMGPKPVYHIHQAGGLTLNDFGQHDQQSISSHFPNIDANYDPLDQIGPHAESSFSSIANPNGNPNSFVNTRAGQRMQTRYSSKYSPYLKGFNMAATAATDIGNNITDRKLKNEEYLQTVRSLTPKFMTNTNQGGLNNTPAYTMLGGPDSLDVMMLGGVTPGQYDYSNKTNEEYGHEGIAHNAFYGQNSMYAAGGSVSSDKAKEILRDGTVHGRPLTERQKRYFGWIAGGKKMIGGYGQYQTGGEPKGGLTEDYYKANATLSYYKDKLNAQLKSKNPQAYSDYFTGLKDARGKGQQQGFDYIQGSNYNEYLSPEEVKKTLGTDKDYQNYLNSLKAVNDYDVKQGQQPLYGNVEGQNDPSLLNYGRRFASLQVTPSFGKTLQSNNGNTSYSRDYAYNPETGSVDFTEKGDVSLRPTGFSVPSKQNGGPVDIRDERESFSYYTGAQNGGYAIGDEIELSTAEIAQLKKQGYKVKIVK